MLKSVSGSTPYVSNQEVKPSKVAGTGKIKSRRVNLILKTVFQQIVFATASWLLLCYSPPLRKREKITGES